MVASLVDFSGYRDFVEINCRQACVALDTDQRNKISITVLFLAKT